MTTTTTSTGLVKTSSTSSEVYGAGPLRRIRPTRLQLQNRREVLVEIVTEGHPLTVRQTFYRAVVKGVTEKSHRGYRRVQEDLRKLREVKEIPYGWITDSSRSAHWPTTSSSPKSALSSAAHFYRRDPWRGELKVEIWCESRSLGGALKDLVDAYGVPLFPCGGQPSDSFMYDAASSYYPETPVLVLYAGDYDPAGLQIGEQVEKKLRLHAGHDDITFRRLAITDEQAALPELQSLGTKAKRSDWVDQHGVKHEFSGLGIEAEAIDPQVMRRMFSQAIEAAAYDRYGYDIFVENASIEAGERARLDEVAQGWGR